MLLVANLSLGDQHIEEKVATLYSVADAHFRRNMNVMLGPPLLPGNRAQALVNGEEIFADMLKADFARGMAEPCLDREAVGTHHRTLQFAALRKKGYS